MILCRYGIVSLKPVSIKLSRKIIEAKLPLGYDYAIVAKQHLQLFSIYWGYEFDLLGSHDVVGHVNIRFPIGYFLLVVPNLVSEIFNGECDAIVERTLDDL